MAEPSTTLRELTGMPTAPAALPGSALIMIDLQNTYTRGVMALEGVEPAIEEAAKLLERARAAGTTIVHVQHEAGAGSPYDTNDEIGAIVDAVAPKPGEHRVVKNFPSSFVNTDLEEYPRPSGTRRDGARAVAAGGQPRRALGHVRGRGRGLRRRSRLRNPFPLVPSE